MRSIPLSLKQKLLNRVKAEGTGSLPHIRLVATQTSANTLLSEPIHEDISPAFGDVAIRQTSADPKSMCAYAVCLDNGIAEIYRRQFPASMDYKWEHQWTLGSVDDAAIEFDGTWRMDGSNQWYYLETEDYPYIFTVENNALYAQKWNDTATRTRLADGNITQLSACKGWRNSVQLELDQGLIIGYIRDGAVYYRSLCTLPNGTAVWEAERRVDVLGTQNTTLSVIRTNDFRVAFLTEQNGNIKMALSSRNYAGMSVRPEVLHANTKGRFFYISRVERQAFTPKEATAVEIIYPYFNYDKVDGSPEIQLTKAERINREEGFSSFGVRLFLDKPLCGSGDKRLILGSAVTASDNSSSISIAVSDVRYNDTEQALEVYFAQDIRRTYALTVTTSESRALWYNRVQGQNWYLPGLSAQLEAESLHHHVFESEAVAVLADAVFWVDDPRFINGKNTWYISAETTAAMELIPVSSLPV